MEKEKWLQKISYYCYTAHSENGPIDGTWSTYLLDVLFACSTAVTHVKMTAKPYIGACSQHQGESDVPLMTLAKIRYRSEKTSQRCEFCRLPENTGLLESRFYKKNESVHFPCNDSSDLCKFFALISILQLHYYAT